jgi:hypothetical protein
LGKPELPHVRHRPFRSAAKHIPSHHVAGTLTVLLAHYVVAAFRAKLNGIEAIIARALAKQLRRRSP